MSRKQIAEGKINRFIRATREYSAADATNVLALNHAVGKAKRELLAMFEDDYRSPEEEDAAWRDKIFDKIYELLPSVVEQAVADVSRNAKAAADVRNALQPLVTTSEELREMTASGAPVGDLIMLLNSGIDRLREIAHELEGKKP